MPFTQLLALLLLVSYSGTDPVFENSNLKQNRTLKEAGSLMVTENANNLEEKEKQKAALLRKKMYQDDKKYLMEYADSLLHAALQSKDNELIGDAYLTKGIVHFNQREMQKALQNYLVANEYLIQCDNDYLIYKLKYTIAQTKFYLGFYDEAIALYKECITYFKNENDRAYLNSLHSLGLCYTQIGKLNTCTYYNTLGLKEGIALENHDMDAYFMHSEGVNKFHKKQFATAIRQLKGVLSILQKRNDFANETVAYFYIAKSLIAIGKKEKAIPYLKKVVEANEKHQYIRPDLRESYELLINYCKEKGNKELQLTYINKLLQVDKDLEAN